MSLQDDICQHAAAMQPRCCQGCIDPTGVSQPHKVGVMLECSAGKLLASAAFMHHDDQGHLQVYELLALYQPHNALIRYALGGREAGMQPW